MIDYLIIGQGTAGSMLAYYLHKANASFKIIDDGHQTASSTVAAGIVNPITGRRYVKSWRIDEFLPFARQVYQDLSDMLGTQFVFDRNIVRILNSIGEENEWVSQTGAEGYQQYLMENAEISQFEGNVESSFTYGEIKSSFQVQLFKLLPAYRDWLIENNYFISDKFIHSDLTIHQDHVVYKGIKAKKILFAEGYKVQYNPYFNALPFAPVKGEVLHIRIPGRPFNKMLKHQLFIVPLYDDVYWVGSNYDWNFTDTNPTDTQKESMIETLNKILKLPYEIVDHIAGIRPSFKNRRPIIIHHPKHEHLILFNGFGTKGTSLAPFWAHHLVQHLITGSEIGEEVKAKKYYHLLSEGA